MLTFFKVVLAIGLIAYVEYFIYSLGYDSGSNQVNYNYSLQEYNQLKEVYLEEINTLKRKNEMLTTSVNKYAKENNLLHNDVSNLRMRIEQSIAVHNQGGEGKFENDKSKSTGKDTCGRCQKIDEVLRELANFAEERDQIALKYNELSEQCRVN